MSERNCTNATTTTKNFEKFKLSKNDVKLCMKFQLFLNISSQLRKKLREKTGFFNLLN